MEIQIKKSKHGAGRNTCHLQEKIFNKLGLSSGTLYKINLGQSYEYSYIKPDKECGKYMHFPDPVFKKLMLIEDITLNIWKRDGEICIGPVVGAFVRHSGTKSIGIGKPSYNTQKHGEAASKSSCLFYYYSIGDINWDEGKIKGYTYVRAKNKWKHAWFPMPDVFYDLGANFKDYPKSYIRSRKLFYTLTRPWNVVYRKPNTEYMIKQFRAKNIQFINNQRFLGKWEVYKHLSKYPDIGAKIPKTIVYKGFDDVLSMLNEYTFIFVKSSGGAQGKQVLSIEKTDENYKINFSKHRLKEVIITKPDDLKTFIEKFVNGRNFIVQQGIRLIKYNERNMDLRMLMMRDRQGNWQAIQHHCRVAQKTYTITNYSLGGDWINYEKVYPSLRSIFPNRRIPDKEELVNATKRVLYYFEKEFGTFGEIGIDIAVDIYGDIWFIEANTKPEKLSSKDREHPEEIPAEALSIFEYAKYLACKAGLF